MKLSVTDRYGNEIYLTDERWEHIVTGHAEIAQHIDRLFEALTTGKRKQDDLRMNVYVYTLAYDDLETENNFIEVVVKFGRNDDGSANNFVLTAYET